MIGNHIGTAIGNVGGTHREQFVTMSASGSTVFQRNVGKGVPVACRAVAHWIITVLRITSRDILQDAINCVLAGQQTIFEQGREWDIRPANRKTRVRKIGSPVRRLSGERPSFRVRKDNRGRD